MLRSVSISRSQVIIWFQVGMLRDAKHCQHVTAATASIIFGAVAVSSTRGISEGPVHVYRLALDGAFADQLPSKRFALKFFTSLYFTRCARQPAVCAAPSQR